jgi:predicted nuclease of predicted toxin-antitoxin system
MRLLFDQNISPKIIKFLAPAYVECKQVRMVGLENKSDEDIFYWARGESFTIVSFDSDFLDINNIKGAPPKIILLRTGNQTTKAIAQILNNKVLAI